MPYSSEEKKSLPPPGLLNKESTMLGLIGWTSALLHNAANRRPAFESGVHRQLLATAVGLFIGYFWNKHVKYYYAKRDRDSEEYHKRHPERFPREEKRSYAEVLESFHPNR